MNIVFIHGMNQQQFNALSLRKHWLNIFRQGLKKYHLPFNFDIHQLHFPFYGDLLTQSHLSNTFDLETFLPKSLLNFHLPVHLNIHHTTIVLRSIAVYFIASIFHVIPLYVIVVCRDSVSFNVYHMRSLYLIAFQHISYNLLSPY